MSSKQAILFLSHGSPMTALGGDELTQVWSALATRLTTPAAILLVSAHWNTRLPIIGGSAQPETMHDFGGFPDELYARRSASNSNWAMPGSPPASTPAAGLITAPGYRYVRCSRRRSSR